MCSGFLGYQILFKCEVFPCSNNTCQNVTKYTSVWEIRVDAPGPSLTVPHIFGKNPNKDISTNKIATVRGLL